MKNSTIILTSPPRGTFLEGTIDDTSLPGTLMQVKLATAFTSGRAHFVAAATGTDGKCALAGVLLEDDLQGKTYADAYVSGTRCRIYVPIAGEELNLRVGEVAGTGNTFAIGDRFELNGTGGYLIPETGSPQETIAVALEAKTQIAADTLLFCQWLK